MKAKKFIGSGLKFVLLAIVAAFLGLHSINLFSFVFPADQQYLAWLGFGLTGFGAIVYLLVFMWEKTITVLQKSIALTMTVICSIGEVLAALFGMQIESWKKAGFQLTENDFQTMLMVVGLLSIAHFLAIIVYFAGDKVAELFGDEDGDGVPNIVDQDYKPKPHSNSNHQYPTWELDAFLRELKLTQQQAETIIHNNGVQNPDQFYNWLKAYGVEQINISRKNFNRLYGQLKSHKVNP